MEEHAGLIDNWFPFMIGESNYIVQGNVFSSRRGWEPGSTMYTSQVQVPTDPQELREGMVIETLNSKYLLGKAATRHSPYDDKFDNYKGG